MPTSARVFHKLKELNKIAPNATYLTNRNPRNLEKMRIAYKPDGYQLEQPGRNFWHKLQVTSSGQYVTASVVHFQSGTVLQASTSEWAIKKQLYKTNDTSAYVNLARVLAQRCLESGLTEILSTIQPPADGKLDKFIKTLESGGVKLQEPERYVPHKPLNMAREEKPWEVTE